MEAEEIEIVETKIPHLLKYMGSKREIIGFVTDAIKSLDVQSTWLCDLFAGTSVVAGSLKSSYNIHVNDIQAYSAVLANTYLSNLKGTIAPDALDKIKLKVNKLVREFLNKYPQLNYDYDSATTLDQFIALEQAQQKLIDKDFQIGFHLFAKNFSGTYWSYSQCVWIDSIRAVADQYIGKPEYYAILSSLIFAMSYVSQSTGHYAQFRDTTQDNMLDILSYRKRDLWEYFERKFKELTLNLNGEASKEYKTTTLDYLDCLRIIEEGSIVYADPPYQSVHYSRFYHALETLVRYDYPKVLHKGRYRDDRHQSPFCKKTTVNQAFSALFECIKKTNSHLVLSYSDSGMIKLQDIERLAYVIFQDDYIYSLLEKDHIHSTMGRSDERQQDVKEYILIYKKK
ncbi:DNA adenine methylase [Mucilaginibacter gotjawali]|uniref:site-specific DNA-methyltransferase (adenine-specific) n=1 Tax=Mucilaginibacter gotjawali TaxID=1550579 RepID=A0A839SMV0_9SPHI|nr:DNA adenine methylase [Mucilaginibacter gotjawali]MBB3057737.1 adenine-specific DNA-methyltransferase [Mucilaginibacter gotjawali]